MLWGAWDGAATVGQPLWSRSLVYPGPPEGGESCHSWIEQGRRSPGPFQRGHGEWDVVSHEVTRGSGRTRGARSPLCTRRGPGLAAARCSPPGTAAHLREGLTWAGRPSSSRAGPSPGHRPCPPGARPPSPARPAVAMSRAAGTAVLPSSSRFPGPAPAPSRLRPERTPSAAPRAPAPRARLPPPQPPPPRRSLPLP